MSKISATICLLVLAISGCQIGITPAPTITAVPADTLQFPTPTTVLPTVTRTALPTRQATQTVQPAYISEWWEGAIFYEIFVRSFYDSNADGIGDFNGLLSKLDYLNDGDPATNTDLGVSALWLMPVHPSPTTHGYAVSDYYAVNPQYGTIEDFRKLVNTCHARGMRVIVDLVLNHTSSEHPWFIQSQEPGSPYRDWYRWLETDPDMPGPWGPEHVIWHASSSGFYYALFGEEVPDLNYKNPDVRAEMKAVARFWLEDVGIDGFRLDAVGAMIEDGDRLFETPATHAWLQDFYATVKAQSPSAFIVAEVWNADDVAAPYVRNREADLAFEFDLSQAILSSFKQGNASQVEDVLRGGVTQYPENHFGTFLTNHDMDRLMTQLGGSLAAAKAAATLYLSLPGVPFIYYGEEIGMTGEAPDEVGRRPMQWTPGQFAGFSSSEPWKLPDANAVSMNVQDEADDPGSLLAHYRRMIQVRQEHAPLHNGQLLLLDTNDPRILAYLRTHEPETILVLINLSDASIPEYKLSLPGGGLPAGEYQAMPLPGASGASALVVGEDGRFTGYSPGVPLPGYGAVLISLSTH